MVMVRRMCLPPGEGSGACRSEGPGRGKRSTLRMSGFPTCASVISMAETPSPSQGWESNGGDPCKSIISTGGTVKRKGLYASNNWNRVVYRCYPPNYGFVGIYEGWGNEPLTAAFNAASTDNKPGCVFNVSPKSMPIFDSPFPLMANYRSPMGWTLPGAGLSMFRTSGRPDPLPPR